MEKSPPHTLIRLVDATFGYGGKPIVKNVSLDIAEGEFIGLIGPNGAGKSTLFKGLLRLIAPMSGQVIHDPKITRRIGYVPQREQLDAIYPLTAFDVARMGPIGVLPWYLLPGKTVGEKTMECLRQVGMEEFRDHSFSELSGGQRQRVLIARALAMDPELLVLDEPTAGIDPVAEASILDILTDFNRRKNMTILMVSHHIQSLRHRAHRAVLIKNQSVVCGKAEELLEPQRILELLGDSI
jgi:ABC-type Mn2+/Zn2+ transport system ATPase subunit